MEKNICLLIISISISILLIAVAISIYLLLKEKTIVETYDCFILSIFWPPNSCTNKYNKNDECFQRIKNLGIESDFIIHGLWPSPLSGEIPKSCNEGIKTEVIPNFDSDAEYKNKLEHIWPGLYSNDTYFWTHEYNKHGYCYIKRN